MADSDSPFGRRPITGRRGEQQQTDRLATIWRRIVGGKGELGRAVPIVVLENDRPEFKLTGQVRPWLGAAAYTPGAGVDGRVQVFNPAGSGIITVVTRAQPSVRAPGAGDVFWTVVLRDTALDTLTTGISVADTRAGVASGISSNRLLSTQIRTAAAAPGGVSSSVGVVDVNATAFAAGAGIQLITVENILCGPVVLGPGSGVEVLFTETARQLAVQFAGYERTIESGEAGPL